jgi:apolipoprotein N-acyltransferase
VTPLGITARVLAAVAGGYGLATAVALCAAVLPGPRDEAALIGIMLGFVAYAGAMIWAFAARNVAGAWAGLLAPAIVLALIGWTGTR